MKKKLIDAAFIAAMAVAAGWSYNQSKQRVELSELAMANVEALAQSESGCPNGCIENGDGCFCNMWYPTYAEYQN